MNESLLSLIQALDTAQTTEDLDQIINRIAQIGEPAIPELLQYEKTLYSRPTRRRTVMRIFQLMGYPTNQSALRSIVVEASRINSPGWETAMNILISIGEPAILEVGSALHFYFMDLDKYHPEIQGLCVLLEQMGSPLIDPLLPELLHLLEEGTDSNFVDEYALWAIRKIGSPKADASIQILNRIILSKRGEHIRKIAIDALRKFDASGIRPLLPVLRGCLSDPSAAVRASSQKVLEYLGEID